jgi:hypothetical protein
MRPQTPQASPNYKSGAFNWQGNIGVEKGRVGISFSVFDLAIYDQGVRKKITNRETREIKLGI